MIKQLKLTYILGTFLAITLPLSAEPELSLTIEQAYELCIEHSLELRTGRLEILAERRRIALGWWESFPSLSVQLSDSRLVRYNTPDNKTVSLSSALTVPVYNGGRTRLQRKLDTLSADLRTVLLSATGEELKNTCFVNFHELHLLSLKCDALAQTAALAENQHAIRKKSLNWERPGVESRDPSLSRRNPPGAIFRGNGKLSREFALRKLLDLDGDVSIRPVSLLDSGYTGILLADKGTRLNACAQEKNTALLQNRYLVEQARLQNRLLAARWLPNVQLQASARLNGEKFPLQYPDYGLRAVVEFPGELLPVSFSFGISTSPEREYGRSLTTSVQTPVSLRPLVDKHLAGTRLSLALEASRELEREIRYSLEEAVLAHERQRRSQELLRDRITIQEKKAAILLKQAELGQITRLDYLEGEKRIARRRAGNTFRRIRTGPPGTEHRAARRLETGGTRQFREGRMKKSGVVSAAAALTLAAVFAACSGSGHERTGKQEPMRVHVYRATMEPVTDDIISFGSLMHTKKNDLSSAVDGTLEELPFREGDPVLAGAVLARLSNIQLTINLDQDGGERAPVRRRPRGARTMVPLPAEARFLFARKAERDRARKQSARVPRTDTDQRTSTGTSVDGFRAEKLRNARFLSAAESELALAPDTRDVTCSSAAGIRIAGATRTRECSEDGRYRRLFPYIARPGWPCRGERQTQN